MIVVSPEEYERLSRLCQRVLGKPLPPVEPFPTPSLDPDDVAEMLADTHAFADVTDKTR